MTKKCLNYKEPIKDLDLKICMVSLGKLEVSPFQRTPSDKHAKDLSRSMANGFISIFTVVYNAKFDVYYVVDGQHRLIAMKSLHNVEDDVEVPVLVLPEGYIQNVLIYNVEKSDDIKDKATKIYELYMFYVENFGQDKEEVDIIEFASYQPHLFTIAFAYKEKQLKSPSLVENLCKKLDGVLNDIPLVEAVEIRRQRGEMLKEVETKVDEIAKRYGIRDYNIKRSIVSKTTTEIWGRKRTIGGEFEDNMRLFLDTMERIDWSWASGK